MALRKAILKLADFDGWAITNYGRYAEYRKGGKGINIMLCNPDPMQLVAAAKTIGWLIWAWPQQLSKGKYKWNGAAVPVNSTNWLDDMIYTPDTDKFPAAIIAAFKAVMEIAKKG